MNYNLKIFSISAIRLNYYLKLEERKKNIIANSKPYQKYLYNVDNAFANSSVANFQCLANNCMINIYKSSGKQKYSNEKNNIGLVLEVKYNNRLILSPGDSDYHEITPLINTNKYDYLIASHHGANCGNPRFSLSYSSVVIVPVGVNEYEHPIYSGLNGLDAFKNNYNSNIVETKLVGDVDINL